MTARNESPAPYYVAEPATVAVDAEYFAGGPLPDAEVNWLVSQRHHLQPAELGRVHVRDLDAVVVQRLGYDDVGRRHRLLRAVLRLRARIRRPIRGVLRAHRRTGTHLLQIDFDGDPTSSRSVDLPTSVTAEATVFDVNRQAWAVADRPARPPRASTTSGCAATAPSSSRAARSDRCLVADVDGDAVAGRDVDRHRRPAGVGASRTAIWAEQVADEPTCTITSTARHLRGRRSRCDASSRPTSAAPYRITATVTDDDGRSNRTELTQWVSGGEGRPTRNVEQGAVVDRPRPPSPTLRATPPSCWCRRRSRPATGIVTVSAPGIVSTEAFDAEDGSAVIEIPIDDDDSRRRRAGRHGRHRRPRRRRRHPAARPAAAAGLRDRPDRGCRSRRSTGRSTSSPRRPTAARTRRATRRSPSRSPTPTATPVEGADVAIVVVDEAVLSLTGYELADPLDVFYAGSGRPDPQYSAFEHPRQLRPVRDVGDSEPERATRRRARPRRWRSPTRPTPSRPPSSRMRRHRPTRRRLGGRRTDRRSTSAPTSMRWPCTRPTSRPAPTAPSPSTSTLPDSLTRYRVMAVAVDGADRFGKGESTITARLPLRSAPRRRGS